MATYNLTIPQGATYHFRARLINPDGTPQLLASFTAVMQVRGRASDVLLDELTTENGRITLNDQGEILATFPPAASEVRYTGARYDLILITAAGEVQPPIVGGSCTIEPAISRVT